MGHHLPLMEHAIPADGSPLHPSTEFDWHGLADAMGELPEEGPDREAVVYALRYILAWLIRDLECNDRPRKKRAAHIHRAICIKTVAIAWIVSPQLLGRRGKAEVARLLGVTRGALAKAAHIAAREFAQRGGRHPTAADTRRAGS